MSINKNNYEAYFLDHLEGTLSYEQEMELQLFLQRNPELALELDEYAEVTVTPDMDIVYEEKSSLKKAAPVISFNSRIYYYAAAAAVAVLMMFFGLNRFSNDMPLSPASDGKGFAKFDITKGINEMIENSKKEQKVNDQQNIEVDNIPDPSNIANNSPAPQKSNDEAIKEHEAQQKRPVENIAMNEKDQEKQAQPERVKDLILELEPKEAIAFERSVKLPKKRLDIKWENPQPLEEDVLWAENNVKSKSSFFREIISSGADMGLLPESFASGNDNPKKGFPSVTIEVPASSNKLLELLFKN